MPAQRNLAHAKDLNIPITLFINIGNANIGDTTVSIGNELISDKEGNTIHFKDSFQLDLGKAAVLRNIEIEVISILAPSPGVEDKTLFLSYDCTNADFILDKSRTLISPSFENGSDTFDIIINII